MQVLVSHAFLLSTGLVFVAPLLVISVLYILIGLRLRRSRRALAARRHSAGSTGSVRASGSAGSAAAQARVIRMLGKHPQGPARLRETRVKPRRNIQITGQRI